MERRKDQRTETRFHWTLTGPAVFWSSDQHQHHLTTDAPDKQGQILAHVTLHLLDRETSTCSFTSQRNTHLFPSIFHVIVWISWKGITHTIALGLPLCPKESSHQVDVSNNWFGCSKSCQGTGKGKALSHTYLPLKIADRQWRTTSMSCLGNELNYKVALSFVLSRG